MTQQSLDEFIRCFLSSGRYRVDPEGRLWNCNWRGLGVKRLVSGAPTRKGYLRAPIYHNGVQRSVLLHRVVAIAVHGEPPFIGAQVNHRDGSKANNHPENIEWVSAMENARHAWDTGLICVDDLRPLTGEQSPAAVLTAELVRQMHRLARDGVPLAEISRVLGVKKQTAFNALRGLSWASIYAEFHPPTAPRA